MVIMIKDIEDIINLIHLYTMPIIAMKFIDY